MGGKYKVPFFFFFARLSAKVVGGLEVFHAVSSA